MKRATASRFKNWGIAPCSLIALLLMGGQSTWAQREPIRIIFLHHSCGHNLIEQGGVREGFTALGYEFYDHGYNGDGLRLADGSYTGSNYDIPGDNTDPDGFAELFSQPLHDPPDNAFSHLMQYDVIAFKSCFPVSNIWDDDRLAEYQRYYLTIRDRIDQYPNKLFVVVTQPPQIPNDTDDQEAARARTFTQWLQSDEYLSGHPNIAVFDFFDLLANEDSMLRAEYRTDEWDAHPNERANRDIGPRFVEFIDQAIQHYFADGPPPAPPPVIAPPPTEEGGESPPVIAPYAESSTIDDFESSVDHWSSDTETGSIVECHQDTETMYAGAGSLRMDHQIAADGWGDCVHIFEESQDWSGSTGLSLWLHSDQASKDLTLMLFSGNPDGPTPLEVDFETTAASTEGWEQHIFPWSEFVRAEWADEGSLSEVDPTRITGYGFTISTYQETAEGAIWIDEVSLATSETGPPLVVMPVGSEEESGEAEGEAEGEANGGLCPLSTIALPLAATAVSILRKRNR